MNTGDALLTLLIVIMGLALYIAMVLMVWLVARNRQDGTPLYEVILVCVVFTPVIGLFVYMLKPYKPWIKEPVVVHKSEPAAEPGNEVDKLIGEGKYGQAYKLQQKTNQ